jgi:DHA1 family multidrug resistance protein-like MFS transporter
VDRSAGRRWPVLLGLFVLSSLLEVSAWGHGQAFGPLYLATVLGVDEADVPRWTGVLTAAPLFVAVPLAPFWGVLADRHGEKVVILRCYTAACVGYLLAGLCQDVWQYFGVRLLLGLTFGSNAIIIAVLASLVPHHRLGLAIGIAQMVFPVGNSVGPLLGSGLIELVGLRGMFIVDSALTLTSFLIVLVGFRELPRRQQSDQSVFQRLAEVRDVIWQEPTIRYAFVLFALFAGGWALVTPFVPVLITHVSTGENVAATIGLVLAGYGALAALAAPTVGRLIDRLGATRLIVFNMAGLTLMSATLAFATTPLHVGLMMLLGAIPYGGGNTTLYAHLARHTPRQHMAAVMTITPLARNAAMLVAPLIGAAVVGVGLPAVFVAGAALYLVGFGLSLVLLRLDRRAPHTALEPSG